MGVGVDKDLRFEMTPLTPFYVKGAIVMGADGWHPLRVVESVGCYTREKYSSAYSQG